MAEPGRYSVPQVARLLGISERAVRKRIAAGTLHAEREGGHWVVALAEPEGGTAAVPGGTEGGTGDHSVDRTIVPADIERAIARTGQQYTADLRTILSEVRAVYEGQIEAQRETIAELRRRAEAAEAERDELRRQAAPALPHEATGAPARVEASAPPVAAGVPRPWWRRLFDRG